MLTRQHLDIAIARGIISRAQAEALAALAAAIPAAARPAPASAPGDFSGGGEERFRIANGFNEVFVALGVILLGIGMFASLSLNTMNNPAAVLVALRDGGITAAGYIVGLWALSEYLTGRRRMLAPSIVLVTLMCALAVLVTIPILDWLTRGGAELVRALNQKAALPWHAVVVPGVVLAVAAAHYFRFGFPFSVLLVAASLIAMVATVLAVVSPQALVQNLNAVLLSMGIATFVAAMGFDLSDPDRTTNRSDCAFWLHMIAAPMIVHPLMPSGLKDPVTVFLVFAVLAVIAILVDRRAIMVASLSYLISAIGVIASQRGWSAAQLAFIIPLAVGAGIIALGSGWQAVRRGLWATVPWAGPIERLRPRSA